MIELAEYYIKTGGFINEVEWTVQDISILGRRDSCSDYLRDRGDYIAKILDPNGQVLYIGHFDLDEVHQPLDLDDSWENEPTHTFDVCLPARENIGAIELRHIESGELVHRFQFDNDKHIEISLLNQPPKILEQPFDLQWEILRTDKDITYHVYYSTQSGRPGTFQGIREFTPPTTALTLRSTGLKASDDFSAIRIFASDGVNYSYATSSLFWVGETPPVIESYPASMPIGDIVIAQGRSVDKTWYVKLKGVDAEGIPSNNIAWYSDKDGFLSRGSRYNGKNLSPGNHKLHVVVTGANGTQCPDHHVSYVTVIAEPEIWLSQGDGTGDLACNEIEINVELHGAELRNFKYGFNMSPNQKFIVNENANDLPLKYRMEGDTRVRFEVATMMNDGAEYSELVQAIDCEG